jgi:hypothetical protein
VDARGICAARLLVTMQSHHAACTIEHPEREWQGDDEDGDSPCKYEPDGAEPPVDEQEIGKSLVPCRCRSLPNSTYVMPSSVRAV